MIRTIWVYITQSVPQRLLTAVAGWGASKRWGRLTSWVIRRFILIYGVNMQEAEPSDYLCYKTFNDFFTRTLRHDARPVEQSADVMVSPVAGLCGSLGWIRHGLLLQAKGRVYTLRSLLAAKDDCEAGVFAGGRYVTYYLSPKDYHRVHMPLSGTLESVKWIPGRLFSVSPVVLDHIDSVFAKNERVVCLFQTEYGKMAVIFVGAMIVGSIALAWQGVVRPGDCSVTDWDYRDKQLYFPKGSEIGHFQLGSTVIVLTEKDAVTQGYLTCEDAVKVGQMTARVKASQS